MGDNPFSPENNEQRGGGTAWIKPVPGEFGRIIVTAHHSALGPKIIEIELAGAVPALANPAAPLVFNSVGSCAA